MSREKELLSDGRTMVLLSDAGGSVVSVLVREVEVLGRNSGMSSTRLPLISLKVLRSALSALALLLALSSCIWRWALMSRASLSWRFRTTISLRVSLSTASVAGEPAPEVGHLLLGGG